MRPWGWRTEGPFEGLGALEIRGLWDQLDRRPARHARRRTLAYINIFLAPPTHSQLAILCVLRIVARERKHRAFFFALKDIAVEQSNCERVLGLLLPPTLVTSSLKNVVVEAGGGPGAGGARTEGPSSPTAANPGGSQGASLGGGRADYLDSPDESGVLDVVAIGSERFAEAFESASVLFAEGAAGMATLARKSVSSV